MSKRTGWSRTSGADAFAPKMAVYQPGQKERIDALQEEINAAKADLDRKADALVEQRRAWEKDLLARAASGDLAWTFPIPVSVSAKQAKLSVQTTELAQENHENPIDATTGGPGLVIASGPNPDHDTYSVTLKPGVGVWTSLGIEIDTDASLAGADISRGSDRFVISEVDAAYSADGHKPGKKTDFVLAYSTVPASKGFPAEAVLDGNPKTGFGVVGKTQAAAADLALCATIAHISAFHGDGSDPSGF